MLENKIIKEFFMKAFQIKITLKDVHPPVWRRLIVPGGYTFTDLTEIFIEAMGWSGYHLSCHYFSSLHLEFENDPEDDYIPFGDIEVRDAAEYIIDEYLEQVKSYTFTYDFGFDIIFVYGRCAICCCRLWSFFHYIQCGVYGKCNFRSLFIQ